MKNHIRSFFIILGIWAGIYHVHSAVTFTITPSAISNTYSGTITLQIGGLADGQTVTVQKFLDTDRSNVVDSSALLVQQFQLTDGQASVFTNGATTVTNFYVPGDTDGAANGSITAALYPGIDFQQEYVGTYLFVLYAGGTPVTNSLVVTNFLFAQTIKGNVVSNSTATTLPYSVVTIVKGIGNNVTPIAGIVASNNGAFSITVPPGTYSVFGYKNGYVAPFANAPTVTLGAGSTITTNVSLTRATNTISGQVVDATSNAGLGGLGIFVQAYDRSAFAFAFTDTNGNYTASVTPYQWQINPNGQSLVLKGYNQPNNNTEVDTTGGSVSDVTVPFQKGTALFYGKVTDPSGNPLSGVAIASSDSDNNYYTDGYSYTNGQYTTVAVGGLNNDSWQIQYDGTGPANYIYAQPSFDQNGGTNFNVGQAVKINFTGLLATNIITGHIQDSNSNSIAGLGVNATATINGSVYSSSADTDTNGNYSLNVSVADWSVNINCGDGGDGLQDLYPEGNFECPNGQFININSPTGTLNFVVQLAGGRIFGHVLDYNGNPVAGVEVYANDGVGDNDSTTTDGTGYYTISVGNGNWDVSVDCGQLNALGYDCVSDDNAYVSDGNAEANFSAQLSTSSTSVYPFQTLYGFSATSANANGLSTNSDGSSPSGGLVLLGNILYGGTQNGGTNGSGTIFAISTTLTNLVVEHTFSAPNTNNQDVLTNSDGGVPSGTLVISSNILYGTATYGGVFGYGTVFKLATNGASFNTLRSFATAMPNLSGAYTNSDGAGPVAGLASAGKILYGTASNGGTNGTGVVFSIATNGTYAVLHTFSALDIASDTTNSDGSQPIGGLVLSGGTLYGTASYGGVWGAGTIFAVNTNGTGFTNLYSFTDGDDGANPEAALILSSNTLFGTALSGGVGFGGTVFAINTNGSGFSVLHYFSGNNDGDTPYANLLLSSNILYGTAAYGGAGGYGTVFAINTNTLDLTALYSFTDENDGGNPYAGLILSGNTLYGTTTYGGVAGDGTVFAVSIVAVPPAPILSLTGYSPKQFNMTVTGSANESYTVQMATNLASPNWISVLVTNSVSGSFLFTDPNATNKQRFYRVLEQQ